MCLNRHMYPNHICHGGPGAVWVSHFESDCVQNTYKHMYKHIQQLQFSDPVCLFSLQKAIFCLTRNSEVILQTILLSILGARSTQLKEKLLKIRTLESKVNHFTKVRGVRMKPIHTHHGIKRTVNTVYTLRT